MSYAPNAAVDEGGYGDPGSTGVSSSSGGQHESRCGPRGIARYFKPHPESAGPKPSPQFTVPVHSPSRHFNWTPSAGPPQPVPSPSAPSTPTLVRRPSTIAVVIDCSTKRGASQVTATDDLEDSVESLKVTSDLDPSRLAAPTAPMPSGTPTRPESASKTRRPRGRPPKATTHTGRPAAAIPHASTTSPTAAPTEPAATQPVKRRGRPLGWRPGMGSYSTKAKSSGAPSVTGTTAKDARSGPPRRRGRPPGRPGVTPTRAIFEKLRPQYVPFLCEWAGCPAELQNIDTLRRHILAVHRSEGVAEGCRWGKCNGAPRPRFGSDGEFGRHVEDRHLTPFVWHVGDGPRNTIMEYRVKALNEAADDLPGYLFDANGNQVTPSVLRQELENEEDKKERRRRLRWLLTQRDLNAPEEEEDDEDEKGNVLEPLVDYDNL